MILVLLLMTIGFSLTRLQFIQSRLGDVLAYKKWSERSTAKLGSGRMWLIKKYFKQWRSRGIAYKLFGVDTGIGGGQKIRYRLSVGTHNDIMTILYRGGIVGLVLYLWLLWLVFLNLFRLRTDPDHVSRHLSVAGLSGLSIYVVFVIHGAIYQILPMSYFAMMIGASVGYRSKQAYSSTQL